MYRIVLIVLALGGSVVLGNDDVEHNELTPNYREIVKKIVSRKPKDRHVMFVEMLFSHLKQDVPYNDRALKAMSTMLGKIKDRKFAREYKTEPKYRRWLLENLDNFRIFNQTKDQDLLILAENMDDSGHAIGDSLNQMNTYKLLYLIKYASSGKGRKIFDRPGRKSISTSQLLVIMQAEQNSRNPKR